MYEGDILHLEVMNPLQLAADTLNTYLCTLKSPVERLPGECFHVIVLSLLLEYFPSPYQRWHCCQKAHQLLMVNGLLLVITPDSHQQHRNAPMMKSWKRAIESIGFIRWRYVKLQHLHCMAFRKVIKKTRPPLMLTQGYTYPDMLYIPQDFNDIPEVDKADMYFFGSLPRSEEEECYLRESFMELPSCESDF